MTQPQDRLSERSVGGLPEILSMPIAIASVIALGFLMGPLITRNSSGQVNGLASIEEVRSVTAYRDFGEQGVLSPNFSGFAFERFKEEVDYEVPLGTNIFAGVEDREMDAVRLYGFDLQGRGMCLFLDVTPEQPSGVDEEAGLAGLAPITHELQLDYPPNGQRICDELASLAIAAGFI